MEPFIREGMKMLPVEPKISPEKLSELLGYDPLLGTLWWKISRGPLKANTEITGDTVKVNGTTYVIGRIVGFVLQRIAAIR